jgi:hypothetical protein
LAGDFEYRSKRGERSGFAGRLPEPETEGLDSSPHESMFTKRIDSRQAIRGRVHRRCRARRLCNVFAKACLRSREGASFSDRLSEITCFEERISLLWITKFPVIEKQGIKRQVIAIITRFFSIDGKKRSASGDLCQRQQAPRAMNILVTGGAGYIGPHACKALAAKGHVPITYDDLSRGNRWAVKWGPMPTSAGCPTSPHLTRRK